MVYPLCTFYGYLASSSPASLIKDAPPIKEIKEEEKPSFKGGLNLGPSVQDAKDKLYKLHKL